ncbi:MAG: helix-turn-helix domain-containing protein [Pseudomonadales bacterium]
MIEAAAAGVLDFGTILKDWRQHRRVSQLALSSHSGISQRHISFLETGRSKPSRPMVLALSDSLDIPLRERNALLQSAGYAAVYSERPLASEETAIFAVALKATLDHHEPYPAMVLDGHWNLVMANEGALRFFGLFIDLFAALEAIGAPQEFQVARLCLRDEGLKPYIINWHDLAWSFLARARRALLVNPRDPHLPVLIDEIIRHPDAPMEWRQPDYSTAPPPVVTMTLARDGFEYSLFTMLAHFGSAQSVTLEELSVETFYPANEATRQRLLDLVCARTDLNG